MYIQATVFDSILIAATAVRMKIAVGNYYSFFSFRMNVVCIARVYCSLNLNEI